MMGLFLVKYKYVIWTVVAARVRLECQSDGCHWVCTVRSQFVGLRGSHYYYIAARWCPVFAGPARLA